MSLPVLDVDTMMTYITTNWRESKIKPTYIFRFTEATPYRLWMMPRGIELVEQDTQYALADMTGEVDRLNDTEFACKIKSATKPTSGRPYHHAIEMYNEFIYQLRALAKIDTIDDYAYLQVTQLTKKTDTPFLSYLEFKILLTRRGVGHES